MDEERLHEFLHGRLWVILCQNLHHAHLQEVGLMQIPAKHVSGMALGGYQGPSQSHGHNPWLVCEVALSRPLQFSKSQ